MRPVVKGVSVNIGSMIIRLVPSNTPTLLLALVTAK